MSAPSTNTDKQAKRHRPVIWGFIALAVFVSILLFAYLANLAAQGNEPGESTQEVPAAAAPSEG